MMMYKALALSAFLGFALVRGAVAQCVPACGPCEVCDLDTNVCVVPASLGCQASPSRKSSISIKKGLVASNDVLVWRWVSSAPVSTGDYGDPLTATGITLCVHDSAGGTRHLLVDSSAPPAGRCHLGSCWTTGSFGWRYVDNGGANGGLLKVFLKPGDASKAKIFVKAEGYLMDIPPAPYTPPLTVRLLRNDTPACWEATFTDPIKSDPVKFKGRSD
jgi:hypothetical protein